jgi:hypothetical protein
MYRQYFVSKKKDSKKDLIEKKPYRFFFILNLHVNLKKFYL